MDAYETHIHPSLHHARRFKEAMPDLDSAKAARRVQACSRLGGKLHIVLLKENSWA